MRSSAPEASSEPDPLTEMAHEVEVRPGRGEAYLTVHRTLRASEETGEIRHWISLPAGAVATALRLEVAGRWQPGELLAAEQASERFLELTSKGEAAPRPIALLKKDQGDQLALWLFGLPPGTTTVQYELRTPLQYSGGEWYLDYPRDEEQEFALAAPAFRFADRSGSAEDIREDPADPDDLSGSQTDAESEAVLYTRLKLPQPEMELLSARWAIYRLGQERSIWRLEIEAAKVLRPLPERAKVVFVVDASISEGEEGIERQLELVPAYLHWVPDAQVEVVLFRRFAQRLFGEWVPAPEFSRRLAAVPRERLAPGDGSNLDLGAALAAEVLAGVAGPARIILLSDCELKHALNPEVLIRSLRSVPRETVVHLVLRSSGSAGSELSETRLTEEDLTPVPEAYGGAFFSMDGEATDPEASARTMLSLVRPTRLDSLWVQAAGMEEDRIEVPSTLEEGESIHLTALAPRPPDRVVLRGKLWGEKVERTLYLDQHVRQRLPSLSIGLPEISGELSEEEERNAANEARVVSSVTSFLSAPVAAAPSWAGYDGSISLSALCTGGCGGWGAGGSGIWRGKGEVADRASALRGLLLLLASACAQGQGRSSLSATVRVELFDGEILEVETVSAQSAELASCVTEATWELRLGPGFGEHRVLEALVEL